MNTTKRLIEQLEILTNKKVILKEEQTKSSSAYCIKSGTKINTKTPEKNDLVAGWKNTVYLLLNVNGKQLILAGSGSGNDYGNPEDSIYLFDDGNKTTNLPSSYDRKQSRYKKYYEGLRATIITMANSAEEIKTLFPSGIYSLYVMK